LDADWSFHWLEILQAPKEEWPPKEKAIPYFQNVLDSSAIYLENALVAALSHFQKELRGSWMSL
jgi:hypothetical protein